MADRAKTPRPRKIKPITNEKPGARPGHFDDAAGYPHRTALSRLKQGAMSKEIVLPHLTAEELSDRDHQEMLLRRELSKCLHGDEFDGERAEHVLSDYAVRIFDVLYGAYTTRRAFRNEWIKEITQRAIYRTLRTYSGYPTYRMPTMEELANTFTEAIRVYLNNRAAQESLSPVLAKIREDASQSALPNVWAPIPADPKHRIPRSIHSESAAKKLEDYLSAKVISQTQFAIQINVDQKTLYRFRSTGKVGKPTARLIAQGMGITLEELLA